MHRPCMAQSQVRAHISGVLGCTPSLNVILAIPVLDTHCWSLKSSGSCALSPPALCLLPTACEPPHDL